jgi:hypothetical protein
VTALPHTFGPAYDARADGKRLRTKQDKVRDYMLGTRECFQALEEIRARLEARHYERFPTPSLSAFLRHLRKSQFGGFVLLKRRRGAGASGLWEYKLLPPKPQNTVVQGTLFLQERA